MIQALYQALQISVSWERVSEIQSTKENCIKQNLPRMADPPMQTKAGREHVFALCMCLLLYLYQWVFRRSWPIQTAQGHPSAWFFRYY